MPKRPLKIVVLPKLTSKVRLFADDTIIYLTITNEDDASTLQEDLNKLGQWENEWCMKFHPDKCNVLRATNKTKKTEANYHITAKANKTLGFLRRNLKIPSIRIKEQARWLNMPVLFGNLIRKQK